MQHGLRLALLALLAAPALAGDGGYGMQDKPAPPPTAPPYAETEAPPVDPPETPPPMTEPPPPAETAAPATDVPATEAPIMVDPTDPPAPEPTEAPAAGTTEGYDGEVPPPPPPPEPEATEAPEPPAPETEAPATDAPATDAPEPPAPETEAPAPATDAPVEPTATDAPMEPTATEATMGEGYGAEGGVKAPPEDPEPATGGMSISDGYGVRRFGAKRWAVLKRVDWNAVRDEDTELRLLPAAKCRDRHEWCSFWAKFKAGDQNPKTGAVFQQPLCLDNPFLSTLDGCPISCDVCVTDAKVWRRRVNLAKMKRTLRRLSILKN